MRHRRGFGARVLRGQYPQSFIDDKQLSGYQAGMSLTARLSGRLFAPLFAVTMLAGSAIAPAQQHLPSPQPLQAEAAPVQARPALWKIADHDTTIYLFGTIHLLPEGVDWFHGPVANAFEHSDLLLTELPDVAGGDVMAAVMKYATLPQGQSLRARMTDEQRGKYEAALASLGLPKSMFDRNKPWMAALSLPLVKLQRAGFNPEQGVENQLAQRNKALGRTRAGLETIDFQFGAFNTLSETEQMDYLMEVVGALPEVDTAIGTMIQTWSRGDAEGLASQLNAEEDMPALADALIYSRNRTWAKWIEARLKQPGTVFMAVGAGHLAGKGSVQQVLAKAGIKTARVQ